MRVVDIMAPKGVDTIEPAKAIVSALTQAHKHINPYWSAPAPPLFLDTIKKSSYRINTMRAVTPAALELIAAHVAHIAGEYAHDYVNSMEDAPGLLVRTGNLATAFGDLLLTDHWIEMHPVQTCVSLATLAKYTPADQVIWFDMGDDNDVVYQKMLACAQGHPTDPRAYAIVSRLCAGNIILQNTRGLSNAEQAQDLVSYIHT